MANLQDARGRNGWRVLVVCNVNTRSLNICVQKCRNIRSRDCVRDCTSAQLSSLARLKLGGDVITRKEKERERESPCAW